MLEGDGQQLFLQLIQLFKFLLVQQQLVIEQLFVQLLLKFGWFILVEQLVQLQQLIVFLVLQRWLASQHRDAPAA